jgi:hypothetical protein
LIPHFPLALLAFFCVDAHCALEIRKSAGAAEAAADPEYVDIWYHQLHFARVFEFKFCMAMQWNLSGS